jgi:hypothetical protein
MARATARLGNRGLAALAGGGGTAGGRTGRLPEVGAVGAAREADAAVVEVALRFISRMCEGVPDWRALLEVVEGAGERGWW